MPSTNQLRASAGLARAIRRCCEVEGTLDRVERSSQFTEFVRRVQLELPRGGKEQAALRLLERTERSCLITASLRGKSQLEASVPTSATTI
jgi:hypothetical protein